MTTAAVKTCGFGGKIYTFASGVSGTIALLMMLCGCVTGFNAGTITWKTYSNYRYGFEFPYPSNWTALAAPENGDGIALVSPESNSVEIRGWASNQLPDSTTDKKAMKKINSNFQTTQGVSGVLVVEVNQQVSSMTLTLTQGQVNYYWQGRSESKKFKDYYRFFYYIAQQYRIPKS